MLRRISYFILGLLLGFAATIFWASQADAELALSTYYCPTWPCTQVGTALSTATSSGTINYSWGSGQVLNSGQSNYVSVKATGYITIPGTAGQTVTVYFASSADDGSQIIVDGTTVQNDWSGLHPEAFYSGTKQLVAGSTYSFTAWFSEWGGGAVWRLYWSVPGGPGNDQSWVLLDTATYTSTTYTPPPAYSSSISGAQTIRKNNLTTTRDALTNNNIYIDQAGDNNTITIQQSGNNNSIQGINQQRARLYGNGNNITIKQGDPIDLTGKNLIKLETDGASNTLNLTQGRNPITGLADGAESNGHIISLGLTGNSNNVTAKQSNDGGNNSGHFAEINISGNTNTLNLTQGNNTGKTLFGSVTGNSNSLTASQTGTGADFLDITLTGNGHNVNSAQSGTGNHAGTINLTNSGGASSVTLTQGGSTAQTYSIQQSCTNPAGCSVSVTQP